MKYLRAIYNTVGYTGTHVHTRTHTYTHNLIHCVVFERKMYVKKKRKERMIRRCTLVENSFLRTTF